MLWTAASNGRLGRDDNYDEQTRFGMEAIMTIAFINRGALSGLSHATLCSKQRMKAGTRFCLRSSANSSRAEAGAHLKCG